MSGTFRSIYASLSDGDERACDVDPIHCRAALAAIAALELSASTSDLAEGRSNPIGGSGSRHGLDLGKLGERFLTQRVLRG
jgi:hypothetical protein